MKKREPSLLGAKKEIDNNLSFLIAFQADQIRKEEQINKIYEWWK